MRFAHVMTEHPLHRICPYADIPWLAEEHKTRDGRHRSPLCYPDSVASKCQSDPWHTLWLHGVIKAPTDYSDALKQPGGERHRSHYGGSVPPCIPLERGASSGLICQLQGCFARPAWSKAVVALFETGAFDFKASQK